jgi:hypothetical protein
MSSITETKTNGGSQINGESQRLKSATEDLFTEHLVLAQDQKAATVQAEPGVQVKVEGDTLKVTGTPGPDTVAVVKMADGTVAVFNFVDNKWVNLTEGLEFTRVEAHLGDGNDLFQVYPDVTKSVFVDLGSGYNKALIDSAAPGAPHTVKGGPEGHDKLTVGSGVKIEQQGRNKVWFNLGTINDPSEQPGKPR